MKFRIETANSRLKRELRRIPKQDLERIGQLVQSLAETPVPPGAIQLDKNIYRIRIGPYRIIYKIFADKNLILIGRIARRSESTYRDFGELFD